LLSSFLEYPRKSFIGHLLILSSITTLRNTLHATLHVKNFNIFVGLAGLFGGFLLLFFWERLDSYNYKSTKSATTWTTTCLLLSIGCQSFEVLGLLTIGESNLKKALGMTLEYNEEHVIVSSLEQHSQCCGNEREKPHCCKHVGTTLLLLWNPCCCKHIWTTLLMLWKPNSDAHLLMQTEWIHFFQGGLPTEAHTSSRHLLRNRRWEVTDQLASEWVIFLGEFDCFIFYFFPPLSTASCQLKLEFQRTRFECSTCEGFAWLTFVFTSLWGRISSVMGHLEWTSLHVWCIV